MPIEVGSLWVQKNHKDRWIAIITFTTRDEIGYRVNRIIDHVDRRRSVESFLLNYEEA